MVTPGQGPDKYALFSMRYGAERCRLGAKRHNCPGGVRPGRLGMAPRAPGCRRPVLPPRTVLGLGST